MVGMMVLEQATWSIFIGCVAFKLSHGDASVDPLVDSLSFLVEEDFIVAS